MLLRKEGSILLLTLWMNTTLGIFLLSLAAQANLHKGMSQRERESFEMRHGYYSGLLLAASLIEQDLNPYFDEIVDGWYGSLSLPPRWEPRISVFVEDEEGKLNLNKADKKLIELLMKNLIKENGLKLDTDAVELSSAICEWRQEKENRRIEFLEELELAGVSRQDIEQIKPYVTIWSGHRTFPAVNVNTAKPVVLRTIVEFVPGDHFQKMRLVEKILMRRRDTGFSPEAMDPETFIELLRIVPDVRAKILLTRLLPYLQVDSHTFFVRITPKGKEEKNAESIIRFQEGTRFPFEILSWREI